MGGDCVGRVVRGRFDSRLGLSVELSSLVIVFETVIDFGEGLVPHGGGLS